MGIHQSMSAGNKRILLLSLVVTAALSLVPIASHAGVFWDDELEPGKTGYSELLTKDPCGGLPSFEYDTATKISGAASLQLNYPGTPQYHQLCGGFADRTFPATDDLWGRFYIRLSDGFVVDATSTKLMRNDTDGIQSHWWVMFFGDPTVKLALQNYPTTGAAKTLSPNSGNGTLTRGRWHCIETRILQNTVGQANGMVQAWKDGVQFMNHTGLEFRDTSQGTQNDSFVQNRMYRQDGGGSINYDRLAFGNTRIGCLGSVPSSDNTPPAPPAGLFVR